MDLHYGMQGIHMFCGWLYASNLNHPDIITAVSDHTRDSTRFCRRLISIAASRDYGTLLTMPSLKFSQDIARHEIAEWVERRIDEGRTSIRLRLWRLIKHILLLVVFSPSEHLIFPLLFEKSLKSGGGLLSTYMNRLTPSRVNSDRLI